MAGSEFLDRLRHEVVGLADRGLGVVDELELHGLPLVFEPAGRSLPRIVLLPRVVLRGHVLPLGHGLALLWVLFCCGTFSR